MTLTLQDFVGVESKLLPVALNLSTESIRVFYAHDDPAPYLREFFTNSIWKKAVDITSQALASPNPDWKINLVNIEHPVREALASMKFNVEESSGSANLVASRINAIHAAESVHQLLIAVSWPLCNPIQMDQIADTQEVNEILKNGWKFHAIESIRRSVHSLDWTSEGTKSYLLSVRNGQAHV